MEGTQQKLFCSGGMAPPQVRHCAPHAPFTFPKNWFVLCLQKDYDENDPVKKNTHILRYLLLDIVEMITQDIIKNGQG